MDRNEEAILPMQFGSSRARDPITPNYMGIARVSKISVGRRYEARQSLLHVASTIPQYRTNASGSFVTGLARGNAMQSLMTSGWYESAAAFQLRRVLHSEVFTFIKVIALVAALCCMDVVVLMQAPGNRTADVILTISLAVFMLDFLSSSLVDVSYPFSAFFWCDVVSNLSMLLDISYLLGPDAMEPRRVAGYGSAGPESNLVRLLIRVGRLSRTLKLLPIFHELNIPDHTATEMTKTIYARFTDAVCVRVVLATLGLCLILPEIQNLGYPAGDESLLTFAVHIAADAQRYLQDGSDADAKTQLDRTLASMLDFYSSHAYGPYDVCYGKDDGTQFVCEPDVLDIQYKHATFQEPERLSSCWEVSVNNVQIVFDMSQPMQNEALSHLCRMGLAVSVMCIFIVAIRRHVCAIVLSPLNNLCAHVRTTCTEICQDIDLLEGSGTAPRTPTTRPGAGERFADLNEFALLEKASRRVATVGTLAEVHLPGDQEQDPMTQAWVFGEDTDENNNEETYENNDENDDLEDQEEETPMPLRRDKETCTRSLQRKATRSFFGPRDSATTQNWDVTFRAEHFDSINMPAQKRCQTAEETLFRSLGHGGGKSLPEHVLLAPYCTPEVFRAFVTACEGKYLPNPFHNFAHAVDVLNSLAVLLHLGHAELFFTSLQQFSILTAALCHDLEHVGVNNNFLVETSHAAALMYNDKSPLENMHCASMFTLLQKPETNIYTYLDKPTYKEMRKITVAAILHTDIIKHNELLKEMRIFYEMNSHSFQAQLSVKKPDSDCWAAEASGHQRWVAKPSDEVVSVYEEQPQMLLNALLHCSDVGNPMKPWKMCQQWASLCLDEFFAQGDMEKKAGIPVQMLNDRDKVNRPNSQIGFIEFMILPLVESTVKFFPGFHALADRTGENTRHWADRWVAETGPPADQIEKVNARVDRVVARCQALVDALAAAKKSDGDSITRPRGRRLSYTTDRSPRSARTPRNNRSLKRTRSQRLRNISNTGTVIVAA